MVVCPRLHYRLLTLAPGPADLVPRGQLWPRARGKKRLLSVILLSVLPLRLAPHPVPLSTVSTVRA